MLPRNWMKSIFGVRIKPIRKSISNGERLRFRPSLDSLEDRLVPTLAVTGLSTNSTAADLARVLLGTNVTIENAQFTGYTTNSNTKSNSSSGGSFTNGSNIVGFENGIILSTGGVQGVVGPNSDSGISQGNDQDGDADLSALNARVTSIFVDEGGSGYDPSNPPTVVISGGGGSGATAVAVIDDETGAITSIQILKGGSGYTSEPTVTIVVPEGGSGQDAIASSSIGGLQDTYDATILSFDFVPTFDTITFQYVFASDEYNEFANSEYNDVFGFFINGRNIALLPNGVPVSINNVNGGNPFGTSPHNASLFRNNAQGNAIDTEMDGMTVVLFTIQANVLPGELNHIKLAIADVGDDALDSNVFIRAASFTSIPKNVSLPTHIEPTGGYAFQLPAAPVEKPIKFDPIVATGYDYEVKTGPNFQTAELPTGLGDNHFKVFLDTDPATAGVQVALNDPGISLDGGVEYVFPAGINAFRVTGIEITALINPDDPLGFQTLLSFVSADPLDLVMTPLTSPTWMTGKSATFTDEDGDTYKVELKGPGKIAVDQLDLDKNNKGPIEAIYLEGTDAKTSSLTVSLIKKGTAGDGLVSIGKIKGFNGASLVSINAANSDLVGAGIDLPGTLGSLTVHDITGSSVKTGGTALSTVTTTVKAHVISNASINFGTNVGTFTAASFTGGSLNAPTVTTLNIMGDAAFKIGSVKSPIAGNFSAALTLTGSGNVKKPISLNTANIAGSVAGGAWNVTGNVTSIIVKGSVTSWTLNASGSIGTVNLGAVSSSSLTASLTLGSLTAKSWSSGTVRARTINVINVAGNFTASLVLTGSGDLKKPMSLNSFTIGGNAGGNWSVTGNVGPINVRGNASFLTLTAGGIVRFSAANVSSSSIDSIAGIGSVAVKQWSGGGITAKTLGSLTVTGDYLAALTINGTGNPKTTTLTSATIGGNVSNTTWNVVNIVGSITIKKSVQNWTLNGNATVRSLRLGDASNVVVNAAVGTINAKRWIGGSISGLNLGSLTITGEASKTSPILGDFRADITLSGDGKPTSTTLGTVTIAGALSDSEWDVTGNVGAITAKGAVSGFSFGVNNGKLNSATFGAVSSSSIDVDYTIGTLTAASWNLGQIKGVSLRTLTINGDFHGNVNLQGAFSMPKPGAQPILQVALTSAVIKGVVQGSTFEVGSVVAAFAVGAFRDSSLLVGYTPDDTDAPLDGGAFAFGADLRSFIVTGKEHGFSNSFVGAYWIGNANLASVDTQNGGTAFGFIAELKVQQLKVTSPAGFVYHPTTQPDVQSKDDFQVVTVGRVP